MKYPWPATGISPEDMAVLYHVRQHSRPRTSITELIAAAVRRTYGASPPGVPTGINDLTPGAPCSPHNPKEAT